MFIRQTGHTSDWFCTLNNFNLQKRIIFELDLVTHYNQRAFNIIKYVLSRLLLYKSVTIIVSLAGNTI